MLKKFKSFSITITGNLSTYQNKHIPMEQPPSISLYERTEDDTSALGDGIAKLSVDQIDDHPTEVSLFDDEEEEEKVSESKTSKYAYSENANLAEENGKVYKTSTTLKF